MERETNFKFDGWKLGLTITGAIIGVLMALLGLIVISNGNSDLQYAHEWYNNCANRDQLYYDYMNKVNRAEDAIGRGFTTLIVGGCVALIPAIISLIAAFVSYLSNIKSGGTNFGVKYKIRIKTSSEKESERKDRAERKNFILKISAIIGILIGPTI